MLWGHSPICCSSGNMLRFSGVVYMAGMEREGEVGCVKENLIHRSQREPFVHRCTLYCDQQTPPLLGNYGATLMLCFTFLVSAMIDTQHLIPFCPWLSPQFYLSFEKSFFHLTLILVQLLDSPLKHHLFIKSKPKLFPSFSFCCVYGLSPLLSDSTAQF
jgi:hypothetical protein